MACVVLINCSRLMLSNVDDKYYAYFLKNSFSGLSYNKLVVKRKLYVYFCALQALHS